MRVETIDGEKYFELTKRDKKQLLKFLQREKICLENLNEDDMISISIVRKGRIYKIESTVFPDYVELVFVRKILEILNN